MIIKRVDDKPIVIHTKQKAKLHVKTPSEAKIKGRNVFTVCRGPKILAGTTAVKKLSVYKGRRNAVTIKIRVGSKSIKTNKKQYDGKFANTAKRRQASHSQEETKQSVEQEGSRYRQYKKSKQDREDTIEKKSDYVKLVGVIGTKAALDQMEGGDEVYDAYMVMNQIPKLVGSAYNAGKRLYRGHTAKDAEKQMKKKNFRNEFKERKEKPHFSKSTEETVKEQTKKQLREIFRSQINKKIKKKAVKITKNTVKTTARKARGTAGSVVTGGAGAIVAVAAGEANRISKDRKDMKNSTKNRMIQLFVAKLRQEENQDNIGKAFKDIVLMRSALITKYLIRYMGGFLLALFAITALIAIPIIAVIAIIYNSPFAIFFPSISSGETIQKVLSSYVQEFNRDVDAEVNNYSGYDRSERVYIDFEGAGTPDNYYDILAVYMVKYGNGDTATDMTEKAKENLKKVLNDMCSYHITRGTETKEDEDGNIIVYTIKYVNVTQKTYRNMISVYGFDTEEQKVLAELMKTEYLALLGYTGGDGDLGESISAEQYQALVDAVSDVNGKMVVEFVLSKIGYPYSQDYRDSGNYYDCSSLAYYAWKNAGVNISYGGATTAASEGKYCYDNNLLVAYEEMQPGDLIFYSYGNNGRFMDITHVAIYVGDGKVVEAANERTGVVYRPVQGKASIVFIGRPR